MKICAMCGRKLLKSMIPFKVMATATESADCCGRCFILTRINDSLISLRRDSNGEPGRSGIQIPH